MNKFLQLSFIIILALSISCKTKKEVKSSNPSPPPKSSSQTVQLPQIESEEKPLTPEVIDEIRGYAEQVAEIFCSYQKADKKYQESGDSKHLQYLEELEKKLHEYQSKAKDYYPTELKIQAYNQIYNELINECE